MSYVYFLAQIVALRFKMKEVVVNLMSFHRARVQTCSILALQETNFGP